MKEYTADTGAALPEVDPASYAPDAQPLAMTLDSEFANIPLTQLVASLTNPRTTFNQVKLEELADSIRAGGVHQPVLVRRLPGARVADTDRKVQYEIVAGERRFRACQLAGVATIPAMVRAMTDREVLEVQIIENLQRDDLSELEEAEGYERLMQHSTLTADAVGAKIGKSRSYVYARLKLLELCPEARAILRDGTIDASRALALARLPDHKLQLKVMEDVVLAKNSYGEQCYSFRDVSRIIQRQYMLRLDKASFSIADGTLVHGATACGACPKRTGHEPELFADVDSPDVCTDPDCYRQKEAAHQGRELQAAHERGQTVITGREAKALWPTSWGSVEGYLRLDDERDSPTGKSLRKLLAKPLEEGVKPVLIDNPHNPGELVAMLPATDVVELLGQQGGEDDQTASKKITKGMQDDEEIKKLREKTNLKNEFEQGWRNELLKRTFEKLSGASRFSRDRGLSLNVARHIALDFANRLNTEKAKFLCGLLELGKVAPVQALIDHITEHPEPEQMILLLVMHRDVEYHSWRADGGTNPGLMLVANDFQVDVEAVKADVKKEFRSKKGSAQKQPAPTTPLAQPPVLPNADAHPSAKTRKTLTLKKPRLSVEEAQSGIAAAMQGIEAGQVPCPDAPSGKSAKAQAARPQVNSQAPVQGALPVGVAIGQQVKVLDNVRPVQEKFVGMQGEVIQKMGDSAWVVKLKGSKGKPGGQVCFDVTELEVL